jgi:hypothetical protein
LGKNAGWKPALPQFALIEFGCEDWWLRSFAVLRTAQDDNARERTRASVTRPTMSTALRG